VRSAEGWFSALFGPVWLVALGLLFVLSVVLFPRGLIGELLHRLGAVRDG
jgi:ABC-type branched-subunit amino acid transport system permease subunit